MNISARASIQLAVTAVSAAAATASLALVIPAFAVSNASARATASIPKCTAADLGVWVAADQTGVAAGTVYMQLEFTNLSHRACTLYGFPGVSAVALIGQQLGSPAVWDHAVPPTTIRLVPGGTAHALLEYVDVVTGNCPGAHKRMAFELRVYPPGQSRADHALWPFPTCTAKGSTVFLEVRVIASGPGVRGDLG
jgi:Protein of unknown function (DUF4232)